MKILLLTTHINVGGMGFYTVNLARYLKRAGVDVTLVSGGGELEHILGKEMIRHIKLDVRTKSEFGIKVWRTLPLFVKLVKEGGFDIIHAQTRVAQVLAYLSEKMTGVPFVTTCHGFFNYRRLGRRIFPSWGRRVIAISGNVKDHLMRDFNVPEGRIRQVYNGIEVERFTKHGFMLKNTDLMNSLGLQAGRPTIGSVGRFSPVKGYKFLIKAFKKVAKDLPGVQLLLVGSGPERDALVRLAGELKISDNVFFTDDKNAPLEDYLALMDIFCLPSLAEGLGLSLMEAMASGCACVASDVGGLSELIVSEKDGILVSSGNSAELSAAITRLLEDAELRRCVSEKGREKAISRFSIEDSVARTIDVYREVISEVTVMDSVILGGARSARAPAAKRRRAPRLRSGQAGYFARQDPKSQKIRGEKLKGDHERILIFELNWLGDILFSFPLISAIRKAFPDAFIACAVVPRYKDLFANNPWINEVLYLSDKKGPFSFLEKLFFIGSVRKRHFDSCILLKPSVTKSWIAVLGGIPRRVGFSGKNAPLTQKINMPAGAVHRADQLLAIAPLIGAAGIGDKYEYFISREDGRRAEMLVDQFGGKKNRVIAINPGANWDAKRWPADNFVELTRKFLNAYPDIAIIITGAGKDKELAGNIIDKLQDKRCCSAAGLTDLNTLAALFKLSKLVISADSGPAHLASAIGTDTVTLFGPTSPGVTGSRGKGKNVTVQHDVGCEVPCYKEKCDKDYECMKSITVEEVYNVVEKMF